jgi:DNA-binding transcriptional LysR family regulator
MGKISTGEGTIFSPFRFMTHLLVEGEAMYEWAEFRHFLYLLKILEKGGFRVAAEELHTSQPNLTVQARRFQDHASVRLFYRLKNGHICPTETGYAFIALAKSVLEVRDEVIDALVAIERGEVGMVRFGSTPLVDPNLFRSFCALHKEMLPRTTVRPTHGDTEQLAREILDGVVDAAIITLPFAQPDFHVEELRRDRIVVCLRKDDPLTAKSELQVSDLQGNLTVIYHPQRHPEAHMRLVELLRDAGVSLGEYSCASHPTEIQALVQEGHGLALIREGVPLKEGLTTRHIASVNWTVDTAIIFHKKRCPKTIPILAKKLKRMILKELSKGSASGIDRFPNRTARLAAQVATEPLERLS